MLLTLTYKHITVGQSAKVCIYQLFVDTECRLNGTPKMWDDRDRLTARESRKFFSTGIYIYIYNIYIYIYIYIERERLLPNHSADSIVEDHSPETTMNCRIIIIYGFKYM